MSYPSMSDKTTRRMVAYKVCNDVRSYKNSIEITDSLYESGMVLDLSEIEALKSIIDRRIHEHNVHHLTVSMSDLISNIKRDIAYFWGRF